MYEFVPQSELKPVKAKIDAIIVKLQRSLKEEGITFVPSLIGSGKRHLVTRIANGNKGFDFDYNFNLKHVNEQYKAKQIRELFIDRLNKILIATNYKPAENNTQAITIKVVDKKNSRIEHSCDFAIVMDYEEKGDLFQEIIIFDKQKKQYLWNKRPCGKNYHLKLSNLFSNGLWSELKEEYLKLKNINKDEDKKSYQLYLEAINNVYNRYDWD